MSHLTAIILAVVTGFLAIGFIITQLPICTAGLADAVSLCMRAALLLTGFATVSFVLDLRSA